MNGNLLLDRPVDLADMPPDPFLAEQQIVEQAGFLAEYDARFTPALAYEVGHDAVAPAVEVDVASVERGVRPPEARVAEVAAETWRAFTPFNAENTAMFGDEQGRQAAMETVRGIAGQASLTGKYFSSGHKRLGRQLAAGEISQEQHDEGVGEIVAVLAMTNPEHLRHVGEVQRAAIERRVNAGVLPEGTKFQDVTSRETTNGVELAGIDVVVARMNGARSHHELTKKGLDLKREFYREDAYIKAGLRAQAHEAERRDRMVANHEEQIAVRRTLELIEEDDKKVAA